MPIISIRPVVLIVEDEFLIRMSAANAFDDGGFVVLEAEHSAAAMLIATDQLHIDLLFTDVNMPGAMDGIELAEHLFALRPLLKVIVTSGQPLSRTIGHLAARFMPKPYDFLGLCGAANRLMAA